MSLLTREQKVTIQNLMNDSSLKERKAKNEFELRGQALRMAIQELAAELIDKLSEEERKLFLASDKPLSIGKEHKKQISIKTGKYLSDLRKLNSNYLTLQ